MPMRVALAVLALMMLGACAPPTQTADNAAAPGRSDLYRFVAPTNGGAWSQGDERYYLEGQAPYGSGFFIPHHP
jgi:hypothetical protein